MAILLSFSFTIVVRYVHRRGPRDDSVLAQNFLLAVGETVEPCVRRSFGTLKIFEADSSPRPSNCLQRTTARSSCVSIALVAAASLVARILTRRHLEDLGEPSAQKPVERRNGSSDNGQVALNGRVNKANTVRRVGYSWDEGFRVVELVEHHHSKDTEDSDSVK